MAGWMALCDVAGEGCYFQLEGCLRYLFLLTNACNVMWVNIQATSIPKGYFLKLISRVTISGFGFSGTVGMSVTLAFCWDVIIAGRVDGTVAATGQT